MTNKEVLKLFFRAENERDWKLYQQFIHPEVSWQLFGKEERKIMGRERYMRVIKKGYGETDTQFSCLDMVFSTDENRIVTYLINDLGKRSIDIFDFKDGMIYREFEFIIE